MIISGEELKLRYNGILDPFLPRSVCSESGTSFGLSHAGYDIRIAQSCWLWSGRFVLASSVERFSMPSDLLGIVHDKSTWARRGLAVQNTVIEPGWHGFLTLELTLHACRFLFIPAGAGIAQIIFHEISGRVLPYKGKYQNQPARPVPAIRSVK